MISPFSKIINLIVNFSTSLLSLSPRLFKVSEKNERPGLIMIQIDGLSHKQILNALRNDRMPYLQSKIDSRDYSIRRLYSGQPSSTPAFQAELFYGIKGAVPAFGFRHRKANEMFHMLMSKCVIPIQDALEQTTDYALLTNGSAYVDIYTGGAPKAGFCAADMGVRGSLKRSRPFIIAAILVSHGYVILRTISLFIIELVLAIFDLLGGIIARQNFLKEVNFIPARVGICILLRELVTASVNIDIKRGVKVIHCNFLGYDEQSHRRGPSSQFAHWTLKGIDDSIRRIMKTAFRSSLRKYEVWIYSDHGQENCLSYIELYGRTVQDAVRDVLGTLNENVDTTKKSVHEQGVQHKRIALLGSEFIGKFFVEKKAVNIEVASVGPVGHVYLLSKQTQEYFDIMAPRLQKEAFIPIVLTKNHIGTVNAWNAKGKFVLPSEASEVLGANHQYLKEVAEDLVDLVNHPDAGDFVLLGWRPDEQPISFPIENGAHAGPGREETNAFALLPVATPITPNGRVLRAIDLRTRAIGILTNGDVSNQNTENFGFIQNDMRKRKIIKAT